METKLLTTKKIGEKLLEIISHADKPDIVFMYIDTTYDENSEVVPFLNIYGSLTIQRYDLNNSIQKAIDNEDAGFIEDALEEIDSSEFEINLSAFYENWPDDLDSSDEELIDIVGELIDKNRKLFEPIQKLYFDYIDHFGFVKIIDK